jgi:hypothetical protein
MLNVNEQRVRPSQLGRRRSLRRVDFAKECRKMLKGAAKAVDRPRCDHIPGKVLPGEGPHSLINA